MNVFPDYSRRHFIKKSSTAIVAGALSSNFVFAGKTAKNTSGGSAGKFDLNTDTLRVGLVGCGGRGTGAASNALNADPNVVLTAVADVFPDQVENSLKGLRDAFGDRVKVDPDHTFIGFDAFQKVIDSGVDVVILTAPPGFRPAHLKYAIEKGKHVFAEKPVAVDGPGIRSVLASVAEAKKKNLSVVSGFCWRYSQPKIDTFQKIHEGAIGDVQAIYTTYNTGTINKHDRWTRSNTPNHMEWMMRKWYFFTWLSGDHIVEQAVHSIDKMAWIMRDEAPISAIAHGGRQVRTDSEYGHIFDHFSVVYEYANGVKGFHFSRQQDRCASGTTEQIWGTKGICNIQGGTHRITGETDWRHQGKSNDMYQAEHDVLFKSIRDGKPVNDGERMSTSSLLAIMGRMAAYSGQEITWEAAMNSKEDLTPAKLGWDVIVPIPPVALPGQTPFV
jgi:myo-inositol 2-dehydrogenase/D-chiro-inositol 1-dehydrogenase